MLKKIKIIKNIFLPLVLIFGSSLIITSLFTWPFVKNIPNLYSDRGDYVLIGWIFWHNYQSLITGRVLDQFDYFTTSQFYPLPYSLAYSEHLFFPSLIFSIIYSLSKNLVFSVNSFSFFSLILNFLISFFVSKFFLKDKYSSIVSATIFTFNPLTSVHFPGHLHLLNKYFLPLLFLWGYLFSLKPNLKNSFFLFLFFTLNALTSIHYTVFGIITLILLSIPFLIVNLVTRNFSWVINFIKFGMLGILFIPILIYVQKPYLEFSNKESVVRSVTETAYFSAQPIDWITSSPSSFIYGKFVKGLEKSRVLPGEKFNYSEHTLFVNILPLLLFILGIYFIHKKRGLVNPILLTSFYIILITTFLLTFGPNYNNLLMPYYYINNITHIFDGIRAPTRFQFLFYFPFSILAGYGVLFIIAKTSKFKVPILILILLFLFLENFTFNSYKERSSILPPAPNKYNYQNLSFLKNKTTVHIPTYTLEFDRAGIYQNINTIIEDKMLNGYGGYAPSDWQGLLFELDHNFNTESLKKIKAVRTQYMIIHKNLVSKKWLTNFEKDFPMYKSLKIYEDSELLILNLESPLLYVQTCSLDLTDFSLKFNGLNFGLTPSVLYQVKYSNKKDCYIPSILENRYKTINFYLNRSIQTMNLRLPLVIGPNETVIIK